MKRLILLITILVVLTTGLCGCKERDKLQIIEGTSINNEIGNQVMIDVYVNNTKVNTPVHINNTVPPHADPYNLSDFVLLEPMCEAMDATYVVKENCIEVYYKNEIFVIDKMFNKSADFWIIGNEIFVNFVAVKVAIGGSVKQDGVKGIYLFTNDYIRLDIPATLEECYKALDKELDFFTKLSIKYSSVRGLGIHHFGVGLWIRNNWIHPASGRIDKVFRDMGITNPDDMSMEIIIGYHYYLNGKTYELKPNIGLTL